MQLQVEAIAKLEAFGITDPTGVEWQRMPDITESRIVWIGYVCQCGRGVQVRFRPFDSPKGRILLGQCPACRKVLWSHWFCPQGGVYLGSPEPQTGEEAAASKGTVGRIAGGKVVEGGEV